MELNKIPKEELELMGYDDIAYLILQESGKKMKIIDIFKKVSELLELPESAAETQLLDFFELMSINKKFTMLDNGFWDLQSRHKASIIVEDGDEDDEIIDSSDIDEIVDEEDNEDIFYEKEDDTEDVVEDDLSDLMVVGEDEEQEM